MDSLQNFTFLFNNSDLFVVISHHFSKQLIKYVVKFFLFIPRLFLHRPFSRFFESFIYKISKDS